MATMNKLRTEMAQRFLEALNQGQLPWRACWQQNRPFNAITGKRYRGVNACWLSYVAEEKGYTDPRWCTYNKAEENGWKVRKGEKACRVEYWAYFDTEQKKLLSWEEARKLVKADPEYQKNLQLRCRIYSVFNAEQIDGIPELKIQQNHTDIGTLRQQRDTLIRNMGIGFEEHGNEAYYSPTTDTVTLPPEKSFDDPYAYMCTFLHECAHGTGHPDRLNRKVSLGPEASEYAREELRAEIASAFTAQELGLQLTDAQIQKHLDLHVAYVQGWASSLKDAPDELFRAIKAAEEISDYLIEKGEFDMTKNLENTTGKQWHIVYESKDPLDGALSIIPAEELQDQDVVHTYICANRQEATEKLQRYEELQQLFWSETNESETQEWRDELTEEEAAMVKQWDSELQSGIAKLVAENKAEEAKKDHITSPKSLLQAAEQYPGMNREQLDEIIGGRRDGLTKEQVDIYAKPEFTGLQMSAIRYAYERGLSQEQIDLLAKPEYGPVQMDVLRSAFQAGLSIEQVKLFAKPELSPQVMLDACSTIREGYSWEAPSETVYGHDPETWNSMSESEQITIQDKHEYALQHPDQADWGLDY